MWKLFDKYKTKQKSHSWVTISNPCKYGNQRDVKNLKKKVWVMITQTEHLTSPISSWNGKCRRWEYILETMVPWSWGNQNTSKFINVSSSTSRGRTLLFEARMSICSKWKWQVVYKFVISFRFFCLFYVVSSWFVFKEAWPLEMELICSWKNKKCFHCLK